MTADNYARQRLNNLDEKVKNLEYAVGKFCLGKALPHKTDGLNFGEAIEFAKQGKKISCWHRDDIYLFVEPEDGAQKAMLKVKTINGDFAAWIPNHHEILDMKWRVIDEEAE